ncbi:MAG: sugar ABC transporter permease [Chloroflexi bacterium]|nr:sugar ABC transporter permease [Chloroflexota bacterium]
MIAPWILGLVIFTAAPLLFNLGLIFMEWSILTPPKFAGLGNLERLLGDRLVPIALYNTAYYTFIYVPLHVVSALLAAMALNARLRGQHFFRTVYYLPSITPQVANVMLWMWIFNPEFGLANVLLRAVRLPPALWFADPEWAKPGLILMGLWTLGSAMIIFLAGLQGVPEPLYEAAKIDGATSWDQVWHVTLPMISPVIFFNFVVGVIGSFQVFTSAYIISGGQGGPANSTLFLVLYLFRQGFEFFRMGYAATISWLLFLIILGFTGLQFYLARRWVYYEGSAR